jgi:hypothetical protein
VRLVEVFEVSHMQTSAIGDMTNPSGESSQTILLVRASRGLGAAMAVEFVKKGWSVVGTVRGNARTALHDLADRRPNQVTIEQLDITEPDRSGLSSSSFHLPRLRRGGATPPPGAR